MALPSNEINDLLFRCFTQDSLGNVALRVIATGLSIGGNVGSATEGSVLFAGAAGVLAQDNTNFFWNDSLNKLTLANLLLSNLTASRIVTADGSKNLISVTPGSAYTQTYSTADKTHSNPTAVALTDNSAGTANTTLEALTSGTLYASDVAAIRNNFADLAASNNAIIADIADLKQLVNSIIDDLQAIALVG